MMKSAVSIDFQLMTDCRKLGNLNPDNEARGDDDPPAKEKGGLGQWVSQKLRMMKRSGGGNIEGNLATPENRPCQPDSHANTKNHHVESVASSRY